MTDAQMRSDVEALITRLGQTEKALMDTRQQVAAVPKVAAPHNVKTEFFAGCGLQYKGWGHMKKDCWRNENAQSGKDTASLETPITPAENTKTAPPITGMLIQSDEGGEIPADPAQWMYFLIDSGAATSVCLQSLADSLGGKPRRPGVEVRSATGHQFTTTGNTTICLRT